MNSKLFFCGTTKLKLSFLGQARQVCLVCACCLLLLVVLCFASNQNTIRECSAKCLRTRERERTRENERERESEMTCKDKLLCGSFALNGTRSLLLREQRRVLCVAKAHLSGETERKKKRGGGGRKSTIATIATNKTNTTNQQNTRTNKHAQGVLCWVCVQGSIIPRGEVDGGDPGHNSRCCEFCGQVP